MKNVGFALLGCGKIANKYCSVLKDSLEGAKLVSVCDLVTEKAKLLGQKYQVPWFDDINEMMASKGEEIDVINVLTPSGYHCQNVLDLVKYKKHLCVEKPLALTLEDADTMISACEKAKINLFVVKQNRLNPPVRKLKEALDSKRFGKLVLGSVKLHWCRTQDYYDGDSWRGSMALDGGVFVNQASHFIDLLQWLMGDVESVFAKGATRLVKIEAEDTGIAILRFKNGALGVVEATTATRPSNLGASLTLLAEKGTVEIGGSNVNEIRHWKMADPSAEDDLMMEELSSLCTQHLQNKNLAHLNYLQTVVETVKEGKPAFLDGHGGRKSLEILEAIYESLKTGKEVYLGDSQYYNSSLGRPEVLSV